MTTTNFVKRPQVAKFVNRIPGSTDPSAVRLIDAVDYIDHLYEGVASKKIVLNINSKKDGSTHRLAQNTYWWNMDEAYVIAKDIAEGRFESGFYAPAMAGQAPKPGMYISFGGGSMNIDGKPTIISRQMMITYAKDQHGVGKYTFNITVKPGVKSKTGAYSPVKGSAAIDSHSIQLHEFQAKLFMSKIVLTVEAKFSLVMEAVDEAPTSGQAVSDAKTSVPTAATNTFVQPPAAPKAPTPEPKNDAISDDDFASFFDPSLFGDED